MMLSGEQTRAAMHGAARTIKWESVERPVGPQQIPSWAVDAHVDYVDDYSNSPRYQIRTRGEVHKWGPMLFRKVGSGYVCEHEDGRLVQHAHSGSIVEDEVQMFRSEDGTLRQYRRYGPEWYVERPNVQVWPKHGHEPGEFVKVKKRCTTKQDGYGGAHIFIKLEDGEDLVLRGPWHVGAPEGYQEFTTNDVDGGQWRFSKRGARRKWWQSGGTFGIFLRRDTFLKIMARFEPHVEFLALDDSAFGTSLEATKSEWEYLPKSVWQENERQKRIASKVGAA